MKAEWGVFQLSGKLLVTWCFSTGYGCITGPRLGRYSCGFHWAGIGFWNEAGRHAMFVSGLVAVLTF